jgi:drug/metabolite transporter (DMT)-like permease
VVSVVFGVRSTRSGFGLIRESSMTLLIPVTTILFGYFVLGERISPRESWVRS